MSIATAYEGERYLLARPAGPARETPECEAPPGTAPFTSVCVSAGQPLPIGCTADPAGANFAVFSRHATRIDLLLFEAATALEPALTVELRGPRHRTGDIWHARLEGLPSGPVYYALRADGPYEPAAGHRFNRQKVLLDPYALALAGTDCWDFACARGSDPECPDEDVCSSLDNTPWQAKCLLPSPAEFEWRGDLPPRHAWSDTVIYETHVRGLTVHPSSGAVHPGTFLGVVEKIPHLRELGVTAVELMPVQEFFERELVRRHPETGERLRNYWGYSTVAFFAPKESYSTRGYPGAQVLELKEMVRALHAAGIEVILDVVFNHTAEGDETGPTLSFRGLDNRIYYLLEPDGRRYKNYSGCGNTLNCSHPVVQEYILDCLRHWVVEMHVDGFRFDLASVLGRGADGSLLANPPLLERIAEDPVLRHVKLIAEAWDAGGAYQVGRFPGQRWSEWNGRYRDDVRRFWRGDGGMAGALASRLCGSADLYQRDGKQAVHSVNFVTCHDGLTLNDLVSYAAKHNEANGEGNRDGTDQDFSANHGVEGESADPAIEALRLRQMKNLLATLLLSRGVPMLLGGDELRRTQRGNNNAYCQDSEVSWYDWARLDASRELFRFVSRMVAFRKDHPVLRQESFYTERDLIWFDPGGTGPSWEPSLRALGCGIVADPADPLCLLLNAAPDEAEFTLPAELRTREWIVAVDTGAPAPGDIPDPARRRPLGGEGRVRLRGRTLCVLVGRGTAG